MKTPDPQLPTYKDFCPDEPPTLDEKDAAKHFLGKTLDEAEAMFREHCIYYGEDLMWMGQKTFEFYLRAFRNYLFSEASRGDSGIKSVIDAALAHRQKFGRIGAARQLAIDCLDYAIANFEKFDVEDAPRLDLKAWADTLATDGSARQDMEKFGDLCGIKPEEMNEVLANFPNIVGEQDELDKLPTRQRWERLRDLLLRD